MKLFTHFSANNINLEKMDFKRELVMEAFLVENEILLKLDDDDFDEAQIIDCELSVKEGQKRKDTDGRIDLLVLYPSYGFGIIELKKSTLTDESLDQLEDYFNSKEEILTKHKDAFSLGEPKWIGILVGTGIEDNLRNRIEEGLKIQGQIPVAAIIMNRYRSEAGQVYITTDVHFSQKKGKDHTRYVFNNIAYKKSRLVLAVVKEFINTHENITITELLNVFPKALQGSYGVIENYTTAKNIFERKNIPRHFIDDIITLPDGERIAVCNEWGKDNIDKFISKATELGYRIEPEK